MRQAQSINVSKVYSCSVAILRIKADNTIGKKANQVCLLIVEMPTEHVVINFISFIHTLELVYPSVSAGGSLRRHIIARIPRRVPRVHECIPVPPGNRRKNAAQA